MVGQKRVAVLYPQGNECINKNVFYFYLLVVVLFAPRSRPERFRGVRLFWVFPFSRFSF